MGTVLSPNCRSIQSSCGDFVVSVYYSWSGRELDKCFCVSRSFKPSSNLFIVVHKIYHHMPYLITILDCAHVGSATASFKDLVTVV